MALSARLRYPACPGCDHGSCGAKNWATCVVGDVERLRWCDAPGILVAISARPIIPMTLAACVHRFITSLIGFLQPAPTKRTATRLTAVDNTVDTARISRYSYSNNAIGQRMHALNEGLAFAEAGAMP